MKQSYQNNLIQSDKEKYDLQENIVIIGRSKFKPNHTKDVKNNIYKLNLQVKIHFFFISLSYQFQFNIND